jgi:hypothetical protein
MQVSDFICVCRRLRSASRHHARRDRLDSHLGFPRRARDKLLAQPERSKNKNLHFLNAGLRFNFCAPTWARTRDPQIMSLML